MAVTAGGSDCGVWRRLERGARSVQGDESNRVPKNPGSGQPESGPESARHL